jgi:hypothetical protein
MNDVMPVVQLLQGRKRKLPSTRGILQQRLRSAINVYLFACQAAVVGASACRGSGEGERLPEQERERERDRRRRRAAAAALLLLRQLYWLHSFLLASTTGICVCVQSTCDGAIHANAAGTPSCMATPAQQRVRVQVTAQHRAAAVLWCSCATAMPRGQSCSAAGRSTLAATHRQPEHATAHHLSDAHHT